MTGRKIMIVDDDAIVLDGVGGMLRAAGYEVITRAVAIGTGAAILRERPDVVLMEVSMPLMSGLDVAGSLRASAVGCDSCIVLFSHRPAAELETLAQKCGAAGFIQKSGEPRSLLADVARFLARRRSGRPEGPRRLQEILVAGASSTFGWARELFRAHAVVRGTDSGTEALRLLTASRPPDAALLGTALLDLPAHTAWAHVTRIDASWRRRIVVVEEPGHEDSPELPGMLRWTGHEPDGLLLSWLGFADPKS